MRPKWYATDTLPFDEMWVDDRHWLPKVLSGERLSASFTFTEDGSEILNMRLEPFAG
jgi:hypothetical protein